MDLTTLTNTALASAGFGTLTLGAIESARLSGGDAANKLIANQFNLGPVTLLGAGGDDILVGGAKKDSLDGGNGRDLLIGGLDADTLTGGTEEDILIGGTTTFSPGNAVAKLVELNAIMTEWTKLGAGNEYSNRVARIRDTGVLNGTVKLNSSTVQNDAGAIDNLNGGNLDASDIDWFFQSAKDVLDAINGETVTPIL